MKIPKRGEGSAQPSEYQNFLQLLPLPRQLAQDSKMAVEPGAKRRKISVSSTNGGDVPGFARWNLEQDYEQRPRKNKKDVKHEKLPVKTAEGWQKNAQEDVPEVVVNGDGDDSMLESDEAEGDTGVVDVGVEPESSKPKISAKEQIREAKEELARIAGNISEDPEEHVEQLGGLAKYAESDNITVKKLALGTQLAVYKDIIPGYRIRGLSKDDMTSKVSKDVRRLRAFEQGLLSGYKAYVQMLGKLTKPRRDSDRALRSVAIFCTCTLLINASHFNCRNELITIIVNKLSTRSRDADFTKCCTTLEELFRDDEEGHASLEVVNQLTKAMKAKNYKINENVLNTFLHLRLLSEFAHKASTNRIDKDDDNGLLGGKKPKQKREFRTKRERKALKERKEVEKEMKVADAAVSYEERDKNQAETLKLVFVAYFRILKAREPQLMGAPKQKREFRTKRERKALKERKEVEKEMKVADAAVSYEERDKNQAETLKLVFVAYFRILKAREPQLMGAVLEGLAKYAHLINQEFFGDILEALKDLINDAAASLQPLEEEELEEDEEEEDIEAQASEQRNITRESLLCIITAFALLQGQIDVAKSANVLHLDLDFFITHLYRTIMPLTMNADIELSAKTPHLQDPNNLPTPTAQDNKVNVATTTVLLLRSLQSVLLPPTNLRAVPPVRVAAFAKQLMTLALHLPQKSAIAVLGLLQAVTKVHGTRIAALWNSEERKGDGVFDAGSESVESSNPFAATVWEGELLRLHFDPRIRESVKAVEGNVKIVVDK
nr:nucleolar complex-associated protein 3 [Quercus suber]